VQKFKQPEAEVKWQLIVIVSLTRAQLSQSHRGHAMIRVVENFATQSQ